jgi:hypothetical protein
MKSCVRIGVAGDLVEQVDVTQWATKVGGMPCMPSEVPPEAIKAASVCMKCASNKILVLQVRPSPLKDGFTGILVVSCHAHGTTNKSYSTCPRQPRRASCNAARQLYRTTSKVQVPLWQASRLRMQASAPTPTLPTRLLLVLLCPSPSCSTQAHAFTALRVQVASYSTPVPKRSTIPFEQGQPTAQPVPFAPLDPPSTTNATSSAAAQQPVYAPPLAFSASAVATAEGALDLGDLMEELDAMKAMQRPDSVVLRPGAQGTHRKQSMHGVECAVGAVGQTDRGRTVHLVQQMPEFWIDARQDGVGPRASAARDPEDMHIQELLGKYERVEGVEGRVGEDLGSTASEEPYEGSDAFDKFQKRLARCPQQCVRYVFFAGLQHVQRLLPSSRSCCGFSCAHAIAPTP